jgi:hypothetical protein
VLAPLTSVILAGIQSEDAGAASGVLATAQQVGAAAGIAIVGIIFFGHLATNANASADTAVPQLRQQLDKIPPTAADLVVTGFRTCFHDRASQNGPTATPPSCHRIQQQAASAPLPQRMKASLQAAVGQATPVARKDDFTHSFQRTLLEWQVQIFTFCGLLVFALPKVKPTTSSTPLGGCGCWLPPAHRLGQSAKAQGTRAGPTGEQQLQLAHYRKGGQADARTFGSSRSKVTNACATDTRVT